MAAPSVCGELYSLSPVPALSVSSLTQLSSLSCMVQVHRILELTSRKKEITVLLPVPDMEG